MDKESCKQEPEGKSDDQNDSERSKKPGVRKGISRVSLVLACGVVFAFLAAWAGLFGNLGHTFWIFAASLMLAATVVLAFGLKWELRNHHWLKWQYDGLAWLLVVIGFAMWVPVVVKELLRSEPKPHFTYAPDTAS